MIKKIQHYLLTHHPVLWSLKLTMVVPILLVAYLGLFALGYSITDNSMDDNDNSTIVYVLSYAGAVLTGILVFIFWLIQYNRNNGLKAHYPQSNLLLYLEWLLIFAVCAMICFIPNSLSLGKTAKIRSVLPQAEVDEGMDIIGKAKALLPVGSYYFDYNNNRQPLLVGNAKVNREKFDTKLFVYEEDAELPNNPIEYIGPSLLYYYDYDKYGNSADVVHSWLKAEQEDSIRMAMQAYLDLHKKHGLQTNLDVDTWMEMVYHPPLYPLPEKELVLDSRADVVNHTKQKYVEDYQLYKYYEMIDEEYKDELFNKWVLIIVVTMGMGLSVMVMSARVTNGRSWIFALLAAGVIMFVFSILSGILSIFDGGAFVGLVMPAFWLALMIAIAFRIALKVVNGKSKGRSWVYLNILVWGVPAILLWIYQIFFYGKILMDDKDYFKDIDDVFYYVLIVNVLFTIAAMFPMVMLLRKWKALPED